MTFSLGKGTDAARFEEVTDTIGRHVAMSLPAGVYLQQSLLNRRLVEIKVPDDPVKEEEGAAEESKSAASAKLKLAELEWEVQAKAALKRNLEIGEGNQKLFGLMIGQCDPPPSDRSLKGRRGTRRPSPSSTGWAFTSSLGS